MIAHEEQRQQAAREARLAIADRTFTSNARKLLHWAGELP